MLLQQLDLIPRVSCAAEDVELPFQRGESDIIFGCFAGVFLLQFVAKDWIGEADLVACASDEGEAGVV